MCVYGRERERENHQYTHNIYISILSHHRPPNPPSILLLPLCALVRHRLVALCWLLAAVPECAGRLLRIIIRSQYSMRNMYAYTHYIYIYRWLTQTCRVSGEHKPKLLCTTQSSCSLIRALSKAHLGGGGTSTWSAYSRNDDCTGFEVFSV